MNEYQQFIADYIADKRDLDPADLDLAGNLFERQYIDSLGVFNLLMSIENAFAVSFSEADMHSGRMLSIDGIAALVAEKRAN